MKGQSTAVVVVVALTLLAFEVASGTAENDAGSFVDAGASPEAALRISPLGQHQGNLTSGDAADWFRHKLSPKASEPACVKATLSASPSVQATLVSVATDDSTREASGAVLLGSTTLGVASPTLRGAFLNVSPKQFSQASYQFSLGVLRASSMPPGDAGSGADAPATQSGAIPLAPGCSGGRLDGGAGDWADAYAIAGQAGSRLVISIADEAARATGALTDPAGNVLASFASGTLAEVALPSSSTYYLTLSTGLPAPTTYFVGSCDPDCGPPAAPCRPMCAFVLGDS